MNRIKTIVEQGKQDMGYDRQTNSSSGTYSGPSTDRSGKLVHEYSQTTSYQISEDALLNNHIVAHHHTDSNAKRFQVLRTKILQQMRKRNWNTLAISSPRSGAGTSLIASNLAVSVAQEGNQTALLVDMNLSNPSIHKHFNLDHDHGIQDYLEGTASIPDTLVNPGIDRLVILPGRRNILNSSDQISTPLVKSLVNELKIKYDSRIVIFDLPPILGSDEVMIFLPYVDCSLLVIESGKTTPEEIKESIEVIGGNPLLGTVLNKSDNLNSII